MLQSKSVMSTEVMNNEYGQILKKLQQSKLEEQLPTTAILTANINEQVSHRRSCSTLTNIFENHRKLERSISEPTSRYKTELCRPFEESGSCKYGEKCQFAHGYRELRNLARHPKYKTELCRTFHKTGFCPYGPRCHFVHNIEEANIDCLKNLTDNSQASIISPISERFSGSICKSNVPNLQSKNCRLSRTYSFDQRSINSTRPKPLALSPAFSLSSADSTSPTSSLSQSPTNSMTNFFSDEYSANSPKISLGLTVNLLTCDKQVPRTPSPKSLIIESRLPVFNKISSTVKKLHHFKI